MGLGYKVGRQVRIYIDPTGASTGSYVELKVSKNPSFSSTWDDGVVEDHASIFKRSIKGMYDITLDIEMNMKTGDAEYEAMRDAHHDPDTGQIGLAIVTGEIDDVGEHMFEADWEVIGWDEANAIGDTVTVTASLKLAANTAFAPMFSEIIAA